MVAKTLTAETNELLDAVCQAVIRVGTKPAGAADFQTFAFRELPLAKLSVYDIEIDPITIVRSAQDIIEDSVCDYFLSTQLEGTATITQGERVFTLRPGTLAVVCGGRPYSTTYNQHSRRLILRIPRQVFHERILGHEASSFQATMLEGGGLVPIVIDLFKSLTLEAEELSETDQYTLAESFLELTSAVIRSSADRNNKHTPKHCALMCRILAFIEDNYSDSTLTPDKVAQANGISMRYLHSLFQKSNTTVSKWIWERRLKSAREDLLDPSMRDKNVAEIAFRRGFNDAAHFSRAFKDRFNISPSKLRQKVLESFDE